MKPPKPLPPQYTLHHLFIYLPVTGELIWKKGCKSCGKTVTIDKSEYITSRIVFKFITGEEPLIVEHKDGTKNNRLTNLRSATHAQNQQNKVAGKNSTTNVRGVYFHKKEGRFRARISINGKVIELGTYLEIKDAAEARAKAELEYYGEYGGIVSRSPVIPQITLRKEI